MHVLELGFDASFLEWQSFSTSYTSSSGMNSCVTTCSYFQYIFDAQRAPPCRHSPPLSLPITNIPRAVSSPPQLSYFSLSCQVRHICIMQYVTSAPLLSTGRQGTLVLEHLDTHQYPLCEKRDRSHMTRNVMGTVVRRIKRAEAVLCHTEQSIIQYKGELKINNWLAKLHVMDSSHTRHGSCFLMCSFQAARRLV